MRDAIRSARQPRARFDDIFPNSRREAWLAAPALLSLPNGRAVEAKGRAIDEENLARVRSAPADWRALRDFLSHYISCCIFEPFVTEAEWWSLTLRDEGNYVRLNINIQEVLVIDFREVAPGDLRAFGFINVAREIFHAARNAGMILPDAFAVDQRKFVYGDRGIEQVNIRFDNTPADIVTDLFASEWLIRAARNFNLHLMRLGRTNYAQKHAWPLIGALVAETRGAQSSAMPVLDSAPNENKAAIETEIRRLIWMRKNDRSFSNSVKTRWNNRCAVTGIETRELLEACHIKPWSESTDAERLEQFNGICLSANLHKAFDAYLICFMPDGEIRCSTRLSLSDRRKMGLDESKHVAFHGGHQGFIEYRYKRFLDKESD